MESETLTVGNEAGTLQCEQPINWRVIFQAIRAQDILVHVRDASGAVATRTSLYAICAASDAEVQLEGEYDQPLLPYENVSNISFAYDISTRMINIAIVDYEPGASPDPLTPALRALLELIRAEHIPFTLKDEAWEREEYQDARPYIHLLNPELITRIDENGFEMEGIGWGVYPQRIEYEDIHEIATQYLFQGPERTSVKLIIFTCDIRPLHTF